MKTGFRDSVGKVVGDELQDTYVLEDESLDKDSVGDGDLSAGNMIGWCLGVGMMSLIDGGGGRKYQLILLAHGQVEGGDK